MTWTTRRASSRQRSSASASTMITNIYIWGNILAWGLIGITLIFYKLDKIYPQIMSDLKEREAARSK